MPIISCIRADEIVFEIQNIKNKYFEKTKKIACDAFNNHEPLDQRSLIITAYNDFFNEVVQLYKGNDVESEIAKGLAKHNRRTFSSSCGLWGDVENILKTGKSVNE